MEKLNAKKRGTRFDSGQYVSNTLFLEFPGKHPQILPWSREILFSIRFQNFREEILDR